MPTSAPLEGPHADRRLELAGFLRSRRERLTPDDVGVASFGRRRTPGLRREEVATLAGVGVTWYTWLEQGRAITPSRSVLNALARTLMLDAHERRHLFALADVPVDDTRACHAVQDTTLAVLAQVEPFPAHVQNARLDVLALNRGFAWMMPELAALPDSSRNMLRLTFTDPAVRARMTPDSAARMVAMFRGALAEHVSHPAFKDLLAELLEVSAEFAALWERHDVRLPENTRKQFHHEAGLLQFEHTYLWTGARSEVRIIVLVPADVATRDLLDANVGRCPETPLSTRAESPQLVPR